MRQLLACASCRRQYDVSELKVGSRFRCRCGEKLEVPAVTAREAAVVRCRACGAPRDRDARACRYCSADFTVHEQDLQTICPSCLARISDRARYCHHCGTAIAPEETGGGVTDKVCPACGEAQRLTSRSLGSTDVSLLECRRCAGLWLGQEAFRAVVDRARELADADPRLSLVGGDAGSDERRQRGPLYRRCPVCRAMMHRKNYGRRSGIIVDSCADHGLWFDAEELDGILRWIRRGGESVARQREEEERRLAAVRARFKIEPKTDEAGWSLQGSRSRRGNDLIGRVLGSLFDL